MRDRVEDTSSDIKASKKAKDIREICLLISIQQFVEGHFRLTALRSLAELQDYSDTTISVGEGQGKVWPWQKIAINGFMGCAPKTNSK